MKFWIEVSISFWSWFGHAADLTGQKEDIERNQSGQTRRQEEERQYRECHTHEAFIVSL